LDGFVTKETKSIGSQEEYSNVDIVMIVNAMAVSKEPEVVIAVRPSLPKLTKIEAEDEDEDDTTDSDGTFKASKKGSELK